MIHEKFNSNRSNEVRKSTTSIPKNRSPNEVVRMVCEEGIARALLCYALMALLISFAMATSNSAVVANIHNVRRRSANNEVNEIAATSRGANEVLTKIHRYMFNESSDEQDRQGPRWRENRKHVQRRQRGRRLRKSIWNAVIESARCEHVELIECEEYETDEMRCMVTATGMSCCVCSGRLKTLSARLRRRHRPPT